MKLLLCFTLLLTLLFPPLFTYADTNTTVPCHHNSVRILTDSNGNVVNSYTYTPYGEATTASSTAPTTPYLYTAEQHDETGLIYLRARYYDPETGRFISRDPLRGTLDTPLSQHPYQYALNNPNTYSDPSGESTPIISLLLAVAGAFFLDPAVESSCGNGNPTQDQVSSANAVAYGVGALSLLSPGGAGRTIAKNLIEQLAMKEIISNPSSGRIIMENLSNPKWAGWVKMSNKNAHGVEIHYMAKYENGVIKNVDDFKFKDY